MTTTRPCLHIFILFVLLAGASAIVAAQDPPPPMPPPAVKEYNPNAWKEFKSAEGQFTVSLPGTPTPEQRPVNSAIGNLTSNTFVLQTDMAVYYVAYIKFPDLDLPLPPEDIKAMLDSSRDRVVATGGKVISENDFSVAGTTGRELLAEKSGLIMRTRYFYVHAKLYQLIIAVSPNTAFTKGKVSANPADRTELYETTSKKFFDSFKLIQ